MKKTSPIILDRGEQSFEEREALKGHLGGMAFRSLAQRSQKTILVARTAGRHELSAGALLALAITLSRRWRRTIPSKRVGIVLLPGMGGFVSNLALVLIGKVPVNLNFTAGRETIRASMKKAAIDTLITTEVLKVKFPEFPWPEATIDILRELKSLRKPMVLGLMGAIRWLPVNFLLRFFRVPLRGDREEAAILFSSGSTGDPKGVVLNHRNIIGNCLQIEETQLLPERETLLGCLPVFHSFGFTATLWYPLLVGLKVVTVASPLDSRGIAKAVEEEKVTVLMGTPTFYRPYFKKVKPEQLKTLKYVVAGAEKTPDGFKERWEKHFSSHYLEGYGLTETSPVISCNLPVNKAAAGSDHEKPAHRERSVGRLFPGMSARIVNPETGAPISCLEVGLLQVRGPNIFPRYLNDPDRTKEAFAEDGWFVTGDLARFDGDGFLFIEGRLSRFSKMGGEMVPHGAIESRIAKAFQLEESDRPMVAVTGIADPIKGEALVLLSVPEMDGATLRDRLSAAGLPNLWIPRRIRQVEEIPILASGKLDLKRIQDLAEEV